MSSQYRPYPAATSSTRALPPSEEEEASVTWLDFIRAGGLPVPPPHRAESADRKRRHPGSSPERSHYPRRFVWTGTPVSGMDASGFTGSSRETAIDLTSPPRPPLRILRERNDSQEIRVSTHADVPPTIPHHRASLSARQGSDVVLPRWQPDAEVDQCPVCQADFTFWYRKHHCRKCGRVVCAACSPHRITIPRQYIVQPLNLSDNEQVPVSPSTTPYRSLGGGEVVRVCNPCVPDPWTPRWPGTDELTRPERDQRERREGRDESHRPDLYRPVPPLPPLNDNRVRQPARPSNDLSRSLPYGPPNPNWPFQTPFQRPPPPPPPFNFARPIGHRHSQSSGAAVRPPPPFPNTNRTPPAPPPPIPSHPRPRREVREEDECPVCGKELPPGEAIREAHIQECIAARFSATPSSLPTVPPRSSSVQAPTSTGATGVQGGSDSLPEASRPRATSYRPRGMAVYRATEKDCMNEEGEPQECVICFEEFQPGDEMGRMECLCKFHRICIRQWWETKGVGSCPTHMLHE